MLHACVGVVIVSTPQDVALRDTLKGISMFQKMNVPVCAQLLQYCHLAHHTRD